MSAEPGGPAGAWCVVSGATGGIGGEVRRALISAGVPTLGLGRRPGDGAGPWVSCDLAAPDSVRSAADAVAGLGAVGTLILCAGVFCGGPATGPTGDELQWAVNHLGPRLLTERIRHRVRVGRVIAVTSSAWRFADTADLTAGAPGRRGYRASKLAATLYARWLAGQGVEAWSVHPGVVATGIGLRHTSGWMRAAWTAVRLGARTPADGARPILHLARVARVGVAPGTYWDRFTPRPGALDALDAAAEALAQRVQEGPWAA